MRLTRYGRELECKVLGQGRLCGRQCGEEREAGGRPPAAGAADEEQRSPGANLVRRVPCHVHWQPEVRIDVALSLLEVELRQRRVVRPRPCDHDVVDRRGQLVEEPTESFEIDGIKRCDTRPELPADAVQAVGVARREDHVCSLSSSAPGCLETDSGAAPNHEDPLSNEGLGGAWSPAFEISLRPLADTHDREGRASGHASRP